MSITESTAKNAIINKLYYVYDVFCVVYVCFSHRFLLLSYCVMFLRLLSCSLCLCFLLLKVCCCVVSMILVLASVFMFGFMFAVLFLFMVAFSVFSVIWRLAFFFVLRWVFLFAWLFAICLKHISCDFHSCFQFWFPGFPFCSCDLCVFSCMFAAFFCDCTGYKDWQAKHAQAV